MTTSNLAKTADDASELNARDDAELYVAEGWRIVPVPHKSKAPIDVGWPNRVYTPADITGNVGVMLGPASNHLADVDLDSYWALRLADHFLPNTARFGRPSKPDSHRLYYCEGLRSRKFPFTRGEKVELIELRAKNATNDNGAQTVFPGSTHESGEAIAWSEDSPDEIATIDRGDLIWRTSRLAVACVIAEEMREGNQRNNQARAWAGGLLAAKWAEDEVLDLFAAVYATTEADETQTSKDLDAVQRTISAYESGTQTTGFGSLVAEGLVAPAVVRRVESLCRTPDTLARELKIAGTIVGKKTAERLIREAQDTDKLGQIQDAIAGEIMARDGAANDAIAPDTAFAALGQVVDIDAACQDLDWLVEGLQLAPGKVSLLTAYAGGSKTPFAGLIAVCVAAGVPCLGHETRRARVLYSATEGVRNATRKIIRIALGLRLDARKLIADGWLTILDAGALGDESAAHLETAIVARELGLVIVDTITSALRAADAGRNEEAYARTLWELGAVGEQTRCVVLALAHDRKTAQGSDLRGTSGSSAIVEAAALVMRLEPSADDDRLVKVSCARAPDERFAPFGVRWVDGDGSIGAGVRRAASAQSEVSVPLRCELDDGAIADRRGTNALNAQRAANKVRDMQSAAPRVLAELKKGGCKIDELKPVAGGISDKALKEVLARLHTAQAVTSQGTVYGLALGWQRWPTPELERRVDVLMAGGL